ncbi:polysaccharide deacetylase family protein [Embleya sp. AB8]|uniref:polysaccharide deacetylase family protein n=1 Tax=Embleya sp. AB8 TaxID=3156304 RepID=UPI003C723207
MSCVDAMTSPSWRALTRWGVAVGLSVCLTATACADGGEKPGHGRAGGPGEQVAAVQVPPDAVREAADAQARAARQDAQREEAARLETARVAAAQQWGLSAVPLKAPAPPETKPVLDPAAPGVSRRGDMPPVVERVPTQDKVVFLTVDDGGYKDAEFARMTRELQLPFSAFVSGYVARSNWNYFRGLHEQGVEVNNHTLNHPDLRKLSYSQQRWEICREQAELDYEMGNGARLFRPPYGEFNDDTLRAAKACGIVALPIWNEEAFPDRIEYRNERRLRAGDIILTHFRSRSEWKGSMADMLRRVVELATAQGFALARLDDYM